MDTRELSIGTPGIEQGETRIIGKLGSYCMLAVPPETKSIPIVVTPMNAHKRFVSWGIRGTSSAEQNSMTAEVMYGSTFDFPAVPIRWTGTIPITRQEPQDNFRVVRADRNGGLDQVEIGVATRGEKVFLTAQLQFRGLILPSRNGDAPTIVSALEHFSYPGSAGYNNLWPGILPHIQKWMAAWEIKPSGRPQGVRWNPGPNPFGDEGTAVLFSSPVAGTTRLLTSKGVQRFLSSRELLPEEVLFLHFSELQANDQLGVEPMTWVRVGEIKPPPAGARHRQATHVAVN